MTKPKHSPPSTTVKPAEHLICHEDALETPPDLLDPFITPAEHFFVCSAVAPPKIDVQNYVLEIAGDAVERPIRLSYTDLMQLPPHTVICCLECAGSQRALFQLLNDKESTSDGIAMTPWMLGGVGNAIWTGVSLRSVLELAGVKPNAVDVNTKGLDNAAPEGGVSRPIPIEKALDPDTILAYMMNGEMLLPDHGFPLRLIVPSWIGANSVKWVGSITVSSSKIWVERNTKHYVLIGDAWENQKEGAALGGTITTQNIKSSLNMPWNATISAGRNSIRGVARSPLGRLKHVQWSICDENNAELASGLAQLNPPFLKHAWIRFQFEWDALPGNWIIKTQATDEFGNTQPEEIPFNQEGYLFNQIIPHPIVVEKM